ncbi:MAG: FixH family protein [Pseudomonadota bacterium]
MTKELKGWHVAAMFCAGFGIIIAVNLTLAFNAVSTFPGLEVGNSYIASQQFEDKRIAQQTLGWTAQAEHVAGRLELTLSDATGAPVRPETLDVTVGRATHVAADVTPEMVFDGRVHAALVTLDSGHWLVRLTATAADGTVFEQRLPLKVGG